MSTVFYVCIFVISNGIILKRWSKKLNFLIALIIYGILNFARKANQFIVFFLEK